MARRAIPGDVLCPATRPPDPDEAATSLSAVDGRLPQVMLTSGWTGRTALFCPAKARVRGGPGNG